MINIVNKVTYKIMEITKASEDDAKKILAGLTILGIAISWFAMGKFVVGQERDLSLREIKELSEIEEFTQEANIHFNKR